jgi:hypothetical protein
MMLKFQERRMLCKVDKPIDPRLSEGQQDPATFQIECKLKIYNNNKKHLTVAQQG